VSASGLRNSPRRPQEGEGDEGILTMTSMGGGVIWFSRAAKSSGGGTRSSTCGASERGEEEKNAKMRCGGGQRSYGLLL
jgi:hypothetical protein